MPRDTSVYVHFPWCRKKCPYCDFATRPIRDEELPHAEYAEAVLAELGARRPTLAGRRLVSVFFGGGTPSLWAPVELGRVLRGIVAAFEAGGTVASDLEVTAECNPSSLDRERAAALRAEGVGRLSIGVQSTDDGELRFLGRLHDSAGAIRALGDAVAEVPRVSADLMFGMPDQEPERLAAGLGAVLATGVAHVSAYALTIEPGTQFGELHRRGKLRVATEDAYAVMFERVERILAERGLDHYEVSNYARPGEESRHNAHYWRGGAYLGLGAAAVGCLDDGPGAARRWRNDPDPARYVARPGAAEIEEERLGPAEIVREALMLGLRTREGVDLDDAAARSGVDPCVGRERALARRIERGDLERDGGHLRVPRDRWLTLDGIIRDLF